MKIIFIYFSFFLTISGFSQIRATNLFLQDDQGGTQFNYEMVQIIALAREKNKKRIVFELKEHSHSVGEYWDEKEEIEYRYDTNLIYTYLRCQFTSDTTFDVIKYTQTENTCFLWGYSFINLFDIYTIKNTFSVPKKWVRKFNCDDSQRSYVHRKRNDLDVIYKNDSIIVNVKRGGLRYGIQIQDSIVYTTNYESTKLFYLDSNKRCIGLDDCSMVFYLPDGTVEYKDDYNSTTYKTEKLNMIDNEVKKDIYLIKTIISTEIEGRKGVPFDFRSFQLKVKNNSQDLPVEVKVLSVENYDLKTVGSEMTVKYFSR